MPPDAPLQWKITTPGQVAYEAYGASRGWKTAIGSAMPQWAEQRPELCQAWEEAAAAVQAMPQSVNAILDQVVAVLEKTQAGPSASIELRNTLRHLKAATEWLIEDRERRKRRAEHWTPPK